MLYESSRISICERGELFPIVTATRFNVERLTGEAGLTVS